MGVGRKCDSCATRRPGGTGRAPERECGNAGMRQEREPRQQARQHPDALSGGSRLPTEGTQLGLVPACPSRGEPVLSAIPAARDDGQMSVKAWQRPRAPAGMSCWRQTAKTVPRWGKTQPVPRGEAQPARGWRLEGEVTLCDNPATCGKRESRAGCTPSPIPPQLPGPSVPAGKSPASIPQGTAHGQPLPGVGCLGCSLSQPGDLGTGQREAGS